MHPAPATILGLTPNTTAPTAAGDVGLPMRINAMTTDDAAANKLAEDCAAVLMGRRTCDACQGDGRVLELMPGHEDCCGPDWVVCEDCSGRGWEKV